MGAGHRAALRRVPRPGGRRRVRAFEGELGRVDLKAVRAALDARPGGGATPDPTAPSKGPGDVDPNEPAFTVRVVVTDSAGNRGEDRKVLFAYRDETLHRGWLRRLGTGGEASQRMWDVDGDGKLDIVLADSSGALQRARRPRRARRRLQPRPARADEPLRERPPRRGVLREAPRAVRAQQAQVLPPRRLRPAAAAGVAAHPGDRRRRRRPRGGHRRHRRRAHLRLAHGRRAARRVPGADGPGPLAPAGPLARQPREAGVHRVADARATWTATGCSTSSRRPSTAGSTGSTGTAARCPAGRLTR